jgi:lipopolysaccharide transport system permease protein
VVESTLTRPAAQSPEAAHRRPPQRIGARHAGPLQRIREAWTYRHLIPYFGRRYIEKRYNRTWLGWIWIPLRPALDITARVLLFGGMLGLPSGGLPYFMFFVTGMAAWQLLDRTAYWATRSLELNRRVLTRIYVPRLTALVAAALPAALDFLLYAAIGVIAIAYYRIVDGVFYVEISSRTLWTLVGLLLLTLLGFAVGVWTSPFAGRARDVRFGLSYALGLWYFVTPVIFPLGAVPSRFGVLAQVNPATAPIEMVKFGLLGTGAIPMKSLLVTFVTLAVVLLPGLWFFGRAEAAAVDAL